MSNDADRNAAINRSGDADPFDPYTEFLELPPGPRPPNFYQLLGVELFCPHPEQIMHAVRDRFRAIKPFEEHRKRAVRDAVQDVMTRIASAGAILTDPQRKQEYDDALAQQLNIDRDDLFRSRPAARVPEYELVVAAGPASVGSRLELLPDRVITIGSDAKCGFALPSVRMAGVQCRLERVDDSWVLSSTDADRITLVNDRRCRRTALNDGDEVDMGGYRLRFSHMAARKPDAKSLPPPLSLIVRSGPSVPNSILNALPPTSILIGHCTTALWRLTGPGVSLHHVRISTHGGLWEIEDLQSTSGTFVNEDVVTAGVLRHRDHLRIGSFDIQVSFRR